MLLSMIGLVICKEESDEQFNQLLLSFLNEFRYKNRNGSFWEDKKQLLQEVEQFSLQKYKQIDPNSPITHTEKEFKNKFATIKFSIDLLVSFLLVPEEDGEFLVSFKLNGEKLTLPITSNESFNDTCHGTTKNITYLANVLHAGQDKQKWQLKYYLDNEFDLVELKKKFSLGSLAFNTTTV